MMQFEFLLPKLYITRKNNILKDNTCSLNILVSAVIFATLKNIRKTMNLA